MKKRIKLLLIVGFILLSNSAYALSYKVRELVPVGSSISINTNHFGYKEVKYEDNTITFYYIKNLTDERVPASISIGLFDKKKKNIGTINICELTQMLAPKEEKAFVLEDINVFLTNKKTSKDIKYIAILGDNYSCRTRGNEDYVGKEIDEIGKITDKSDDKEIELFKKVLMVVGALVVIPIVYKFLCTTSFQNFDGEEVRKDFREWQKNKEIQKPDDASSTKRGTGNNTSKAKKNNKPNKLDEEKASDNRKKEVSKEKSEIGNSNNASKNVKKEAKKEEKENDLISLYK